MNYTARHFRLTRLAHMRGLKATRLAVGGYLVSSHSRPGHSYRVTPDGKCECPALLSCTHGELVRKIEANGNPNTREWQAYTDAWRADFLRLRLRILRGRLRGSDRDYLNWCRKARPLHPAAKAGEGRAAAESFAARSYA